MLMKCQLCGHENQLGAIFCRGCGGKLDTELLRPKVEHTESSGGFGSVIRKLMGFIIFSALVAVIAMLFYPDDLSNYSPLSGDNAAKAAKEKFESILKKAEQGFGNDTYTLTAPEATYLYNSYFLAKTAAPGSDKPANAAPAPANATPASAEAPAYNIEKVVFDIDSVGFVHIILRTKLFDKIPVTFELKGSVVNAPTKEVGKPSITFSAIEYKMGHMPVKFAEQQVLDKFMPTLTGRKIEQILKAITKIEVNDAKNFVVKF
ncbi:MAG: zinc ribbon domain-containing protein [Victivallales bacterium]